MQQVKYYSCNQLSASHVLIFYFLFFYLYFENLVTITIVITYSVKIVPKKKNTRLRRSIFFMSAIIAQHNLLNTHLICLTFKWIQLNNIDSILHTISEVSI